MSPKSDGGSAKKPTGKSTNNLVALGSIAVLGVYAAGYARTAAAADRFAKAAQRHPAAVIARADNPPVAAVQPGTSGNAAPTPASTAGAGVATPADSKPGAAPKVAGSTEVATAPAASTATSAKPAAVTLGTTQAKAPAATEPAKDTVVTAKPATVVAAAPPSAVPARTEPVPAKAASPVVDSAAIAKEAEKQRVAWKDGAYVGYGTSRHGDIEATIEIKAGKIISASISDCRTQYSCSWISALPPQVITRQSPEVDYVSGATQSSNAFYAAIVDALSKAK